MTGPDDRSGGPRWPPGSDPAAPTTTGGWSAAVTGPGGPTPDAPARPWAGLGPPKLFGIVIAVLGALNFVFGFLPQVTVSRIDESLSVYAVGPGYVPILLLIAGLLALAAFLPGSERSRLAVAAVSVGGAAGAVISLGTSGAVELTTSAQVTKGLGAVLLTIFGIIQAVVAIAAYVVGADVRGRSRLPGAADPGVWPAPQGRMSGPTRFAPAQPYPSAPAPQPSGSVAYYAGYPPVPGSAAGPGVAGAPGWGPPGDDDRPTGPQQVVDQSVDPNSAAVPEHSRQGPAERELPRVAPVVLDKPAAPTEAYRVPVRPAAPHEPGNS